MYQQINVLKHLFIAASREENYPVSLREKVVSTSLLSLLMDDRISFYSIQRSSPCRALKSIKDILLTE
jgi:hypothetical protein